MNYIIKLLLIISFSIFLMGLQHASKTEAQILQNEDFILRLDNFDFSKKPVSNTDEANIGNKMYGGENWQVRNGFEFKASNTPFSFSVSSRNINYGPINPGEPITRTNSLRVTPGSALGYQILVQAEDELKTDAGQTIPDTTCDSGNCSESTPSIWASPLVFGFGYRCDNLSGGSCFSDFSDNNFYKQFANRALQENAQRVLFGHGAGETYESQITYKINIPQNQASGIYQNTIFYIALPSI